jgi:hypothetical protein
LISGKASFFIFPLTVIVVLLLVVGRIFDLDWDTSVTSYHDLTIHVMETVRWTWTDLEYHTVVALDGSFDSGPPTMAPFSFEHSFTTEGVFEYECSTHPSSMRGTITVELGTNDRSRLNYCVLKNFVTLFCNWFSAGLSAGKDPLPLHRLAHTHMHMGTVLCKQFWLF